VGGELMRGRELDFVQRDGDAEVTTLASDVAVSNMVVTSIRSVGVRRPRVRLGKKVLHPRGVMWLGRVHLRAGDRLSIEFAGDGRVSIHGYLIPRWMGGGEVSQAWRNFVRDLAQAPR
jgi:hypothetical protein